MLRLDGKVALVTGCGSMEEGWGNGKAIAVLFARQGASMFGVDMSLAAAEATRVIIVGEGGIAEVSEANVTVAADIEKMVESCMARFGRIDILVNNVGRSEPGGPVEMSEETWDEQIDVNVKSAFLTCKAVLPIMERQGGGSIVNVSSVAGLRYVGKPQVAYAAAKAALMQLTRTTAVLYAARGIRLNCVTPGLMFTLWFSVSRTSTRRAISRALSRRATSRCRWAAWETPGTSRIRRCFWPPTKASTLLRSRSSSMAD